MDRLIAFAQSGDMVGFKGVNKYAKLIGWNTLSDWSHFGVLVWVKFGDGEPTLCVIEAVIKYGVRLIALEDVLKDCKKTGERAFWFVLDRSHDLNRPILVDYVRRQLGKRYASPYQMVYSFGWLTRLWRYLRGLPARDMDSDRFFCSELGAAGLQAIGISPRKIPAEMSPADLANEPAIKIMAEITYNVGG